MSGGQPLNRMFANSILTFEDWDFLKEPLTITNFVNKEKLPQETKVITIERNDDYALRGTVKFKPTDDFFRLRFERSDNTIAGSFSKGLDLIGHSEDNSIAYELEACHIGDTHISGTSEHSGIADLSFKSLKTILSDNTPHHLTEWYLNGPKSVPLDSSEGRNLLVFRKPDYISIVNKTLDLYSTPFGCRGLLFCRYNDFNFLIHQVSSVFPQWSVNMAIEYRENWGRIPAEDERIKIEELSSFIFGKHLLSIGHTTYDDNEEVVQAYVQSPWDKDARINCQIPEMPPIRLRQFPPGDAEKAINFLLPQYLEYCQPLCLREALWNYWISSYMPIGTNLPLIVAAIETMILSWYKWTKTKSHGVYQK